MGQTGLEFGAQCRGIERIHLSSPGGQRLVSRWTLIAQRIGERGTFRIDEAGRGAALLLQLVDEAGNLRRRARDGRDLVGTGIEIECVSSISLKAKATKASVGTRYAIAMRTGILMLFRRGIAPILTSGDPPCGCSVPVLAVGRCVQNEFGRHVKLLPACWP
jgi:hypothetical protein